MFITLNIAAGELKHLLKSKPAAIMEIRAKKNENNEGNSSEHGQLRA